MLTDYLPLVFGVLVLIGLKIFLANRSFNKNKALYQRPRDLAVEILSKKKREMADILAKIHDVNQLNLLLIRNLGMIKAEWENILATNSKNCDNLSERFRQVALFLNIMLLQHKKDPKPDTIMNKLKFLDKTFRTYKKTLDEIKVAMDEGKYFSKYECGTISNYYLDIFEIIDQYK